jgi:hypothetical protein
MRLFMAILRRTTGHIFFSIIVPMIAVCDDSQPVAAASWRQARELLTCPPLEHVQQLHEPDFQHGNLSFYVPTTLVADG